MTGQDRDVDVIGHGCMLWYLQGSGNQLRCMAESAPSNPSGFSTLVGAEHSRLLDGSFLLGVLCWETGIESVG